MGNTLAAPVLFIIEDKKRPIVFYITLYCQSSSIFPFLLLRTGLSLIDDE
jgi:hypothetical protein